MAKAARAKRQSVEINTYLSRATERAPRQTEASMLAFPDGRLLVAYSDFNGGVNLDEGPGRIAGRWSLDEGRSWGEPFVLQENIGKINCMSASLLQLPAAPGRGEGILPLRPAGSLPVRVSPAANGRQGAGEGGTRTGKLPSPRILLAFGRKDAQPTLLHGMVKWSDDEGRTWNSPRDITRGDRYWCMTNDRLVRLASGRILYPVESGAESECCAWYSDDDGATWRMSEPNVIAAKGLYYAEPCVIELKDGRVAMYIRTTAGNIHVAMSEDRGASWRLVRSAPADMAGRPDTGPNAAYSPCLVKRVPSTGDLLLIWNNNRVRTPLTAAISSDEGQTWRHFRNLEEMDGWPPKRTHTYPSITFSCSGDSPSPNGGEAQSPLEPSPLFVHLTYWEAEKLSHEPQKFFMHLKYRRLPLAWFYERP